LKLPTVTDIRIEIGSDVLTSLSDTKREQCNAEYKRASELMSANFQLSKLPATLSANEYALSTVSKISEIEAISVHQIDLMWVR